MNAILPPVRRSPNWMLAIWMLLLAWSATSGAQQADEDYLGEDPRIMEMVKSGLLRTMDLGPRMGELVADETKILTAPMRQLMETTNQSRVARFQKMAKKTPEIRSIFAKFQIEQETKAKTEATDTQILRIAAVPSASERLLPAFLPGFLSSLRYEQIERKAIEDPRLGKGFKVMGNKATEVGKDSILVLTMSTAEALNALARGEIDVAILSRPPTAEENKKFKPDLADLALPSFSSVIAAEAFALVVNDGDSKPRTDRVVYLSELNEWLGGGRVWCRPAASSDLGEMDEFLKSRLNVDTLAAKNIKIAASPEAILQAVAATPNSFGLVPSSKTPPHLAVKIASSPHNPKGLPPARIFVRSEDYALIRQFQLCVTQNRSILAKQFRDYAVGHGQLQIRESGLIDQAPSDAQEQAAWREEAQTILTRYSGAAFDDYRAMIKDCDRASTPFVVHFRKGVGALELYSNVSPNALPRIRGLVKELSATDPDAALVLIGHTDYDGTTNFNQDLGLRRAQSLADELVAMGLKVEKFKSMGELMPVATNETEDGKALNRRVEIWIHRNPKAPR